MRGSVLLVCVAVLVVAAVGPAGAAAAWLGSEHPEEGGAAVDATGDGSETAKPSGSEDAKPTPVESVESAGSVGASGGAAASWPKVGALGSPGEVEAADDTLLEGLRRRDGTPVRARRMRPSRSQRSVRMGHGTCPLPLQTSMPAWPPRQQCTLQPSPSQMRLQKPYKDWACEAPQSEFWTRWWAASGIGEWKKPTEEEIAKRPLLEFVMIVKNENESIADTIASVKPYVDRWTIMDTGSTDGTQETIKKAFEGVPGNLTTGPFIDFSQAHNLALEHAGTRSVFTLFLHGDEYLRQGAELRDFLENHRSFEWASRWGMMHEAYTLRIEFGKKDTFELARIFRTDSQWFYNAPTHEFAINAFGHPAHVKACRRPDSIAPTEKKAGFDKGKQGAWGLRRVPTQLGKDPSIYHDIYKTSWDDRRSRFKKDAEMLENSWNRKKTQRTAFYLGQTYNMLGNHSESRRWYERAIVFNGWHEEIAEAYRRIANMAKPLNMSWDKTLELLLNSYEMQPDRREALIPIAEHYNSKQKWHLGCLFAKAASEISFPVDSRLFLDRSMYDIRMDDTVATCAYYLHKFEWGEKHARRAFLASPNERRRRNLQYYTDKRGGPAPRMADAQDTVDSDGTVRRRNREGGEVQDGNTGIKLPKPGLG